MRRKTTQISLIIVGVILLAFGVLKVASNVSGSFSSDGSTLTLMVKPQWILIAFCGALLCVVSLFLGKKHG